ncbi:isocitrate lyase/phosphoenolpyruvate mutase family protein [Streptomyces sp. BRA346]|uniref:isocitrate lyase/phosphoenolpyruvate mutase family protein n=1 Tax=Streptomyces sp. BRA346 TaxID=2878199 RepID=UPI0040644A56
MRLGFSRESRRSRSHDDITQAREDCLLGLGDPDIRLKETLARTHMYLDAGADGIFVPGVTDTATIAALATDIAVPLNGMAGPGSPTVAERGALGVARVSLGSGVAQAAYGAARRAAQELFGTGGDDSLAEGMAFPELDALFSDPH